MEGDVGVEETIGNYLHHLPHYLHQSNGGVVPSPLGDQNYCLSHQLFWQPSLLEGGLNQLHHLPPVGHGWWLCLCHLCYLRLCLHCRPWPCLLRRILCGLCIPFLLQTHLEVIHSHIGRASGVVRPQPPHHPLNIVLRSYQVIHRKRLNGYRYVLPREWYMAIQRNPLHRDPLYENSGRQRPMVFHCLIPPLCPVPCFIVEGGVQDQ